jgi:hypothetical protein
MLIVISAIIIGIGMDNGPVVTARAAQSFTFIARNP